MGRGITVMHIYSDQLRNLSLAIPPVNEQCSIAAFLDHETSRIDALVAKKERLVGLLRKSVPPSSPALLPRGSTLAFR